MGYHLKDIKTGQLGESSKIQEELEELLDAEAQGSKVMALVELSDLIGSIEAYLENKYPGLTLEDLKNFSNITKRAFKDGTRKPKT